MKICVRCKIKQEYKDFVKDKISKDGYKHTCKSCIKLYRISRRDKDREYTSQWKELNLNKIQQYYIKRRDSNKINEYYKQKRLNPHYRLKENLRNRIYKFLKGTKSKTTEQILGINYENYIIYLESLFDFNMNWGNYGSYWEIDHIIPLSKSGSFHYTNTKPLTIKENRIKSNKL
jgi:hypothetical protein